MKNRSGIWVLVMGLSCAACGEDAKPSGTGGGAPNGGSGGVAGSSSAGSSVGGSAGAGGSHAMAGSSGSGGSAGVAPTRPRCEELEAGKTGEHGLTNIYSVAHVLGSSAINVDGETLYFQAAGKLMTYPLAGGEPTEIGEYLQDEQRVYKGTLYWIHNESTEPRGTLMSAPLSELTQATMLAENVPVSRFIAIDDSNFYVAQNDAGGVFKVPLAGGAATLMVEDVDPAGFALTGGYLYWTERRTNQLERIAVAGGQREQLAPTMLPNELVATESGAFFIDGNRERIATQGTAPTEAKVLWSAPDEFTTIESIAALGSDVYFMTGFGCGEVWHAKADGSASELVVQGTDGAEWLHVTPTNVLVVSYRGGLYRMDR